MVHLLKIEIKKRETPSKVAEFITVIIAAVVALLIGAVLIYLEGADPILGYKALLIGSLGNRAVFLETLVKMAPLLLAGLGMVVAYQCKFWNIGGEGQIFAGALVTTWVGITFTKENPGILPLVILLSFLGGMAWALIPAVLKVKLQINEIITTLLMNFIIIYYIDYLVLGPWMDPISVMPQSVRINPSARLMEIVPGSRLHAGFLIAMVCAPLVYILLQKTVLGYRIMAVGNNPEAARAGGIDIAKTILIAAAISGGLAGLAGMGEVSGLHYRLRTDISPGYGYTAILVALLARLHPFLVVVTSFFFAVLFKGGDALKRVTGVPTALIPVIQSIVFISILASEVITRYEIRIKRR
ncbi:ABC transporter permease [Candidatus Hecatella orcuttiae]|jgi:simple sugar transport system permease protein|uniref:ABC transporter permease n=1 Tax=Candidatus Hecatella orcuttiae TaxID=1935119 RepID=UPI00286807A8|nr:ABC transporter permease [Candidatus Hecatella orcuttiae]